jgi:DNA-binding MarR family transcriptional regulator
LSEDLRAQAARSLISTLPFVMGNVGAGMRAAGGEVTPHQHRLLSMIAARPRTLSQVADVQGVTPATATTIVTTLENRGWVLREHDAKDRRCVVVTITDDGRRQLAAAQEAAEQAVVDALAPLSDDEVLRLLGGLDVLSGLRSQRAHHCRADGSPKAREEGGSETT